MGAIKPNDYTSDEIDISLIARGIAHPVRVRILKQLEHGPYRNIDFCRDLRMAKSTIKEHVDKLLDADLVFIQYFPHHYLLRLNKKRMTTIIYLMSSAGKGADVRRGVPGFNY